MGVFCPAQNETEPAGHIMNKPSRRYLAVLALSLLLGEARADYWTVDELVEGFNQVSAQIALNSRAKAASRR